MVVLSPGSNPVSQILGFLPFSAGMSASEQSVAITPPVALNANTTWGNNLSAENNYGLGAEFLSTNGAVAVQAQSYAGPSWWVLIAILIVGGLFL